MGAATRAVDGGGGSCSKGQDVDKTMKCSLEEKVEADLMAMVEEGKEQVPHVSKSFISATCAWVSSRTDDTQLQAMQPPTEPPLLNGCDEEPSNEATNLKSQPQSHFSAHLQCLSPHSSHPGANYGGLADASETGSFLFLPHEYNVDKTSA
ncbi:uncharacterized protein UTRI_05777 [Ustilago trichophora]|uniref:Uncharacterized protein n=1 Tax=Ustilago trichophora TaxID=86804 RepID=A0A5C3EI94_9BASI|nr:uncharacterized protein UTRI_05777 [Ustilago trichophora]